MKKNEENLNNQFGMILTLNCASQNSTALILISKTQFILPTRTNKRTYRLVSHSKIEKNKIFLSFSFFILIRAHQFAHGTHSLIKIFFKKNQKRLKENLHVLVGDHTLLRCLLLVVYAFRFGLTDYWWIFAVVVVLVVWCWCWWSLEEENKILSLF